MHNKDKMYNKILNRPMFKLGGDTADAQGTGITSGLDTPRRGLVTGPGGYKGDIDTTYSAKDAYFKPTYANTFEEKIKERISGLGVKPEDYRQETWEGVAGGFGDPSTKTLSEAVWKANMMRREGIKPLEASVAEQKFELSKMPFELEMGKEIAKAGIAETAAQTDERTLAKATALKKNWEENPANKGKDFQNSEVYSDWEHLIIQATDGKITTLSEARMIAFEILSGKGDTMFAKQWNLFDSLSKEQQAKLLAQLKRTTDLLRGRNISQKASGGRAGYQFGVGPNVMEEKVTDTLEMPGETIQASEQVEEVLPKNGSMSQIPMPGQDPYMLLRARLPQEITDDVVRLIAYNPEAFADFAAIESQEDVVLFNQKYGVELVLPTEQA